MRKKKLRTRNLDVLDVWNVLKSAHSRIYDEAEEKNGSYRYRLETNNMTVAISFESNIQLVIVTAWRKT